MMIIKLICKECYIKKYGGLNAGICGGYLKITKEKKNVKFAVKRLG